MYTAHRAMLEFQTVSVAPGAGETDGIKTQGRVLVAVGVPTGVGFGAFNIKQKSPLGTFVPAVLHYANLTEYDNDYQVTTQGGMGGVHVVINPMQTMAADEIQLNFAGVQYTATEPLVLVWRPVW